MNITTNYLQPDPNPSTSSSTSTTTTTTKTTSSGSETKLVFNSDNDIILFDIDTKEFIICPYNLKSFMIREYIEEAKTND